MMRNRRDVVGALILINVVVYLVGLFDNTRIPAFCGVPTPQGVPTPVLEVYGAYSYYTCFDEHQFCRLVSYQFLHANLGHLLFNMIALHVFGGAVASRFGTGRFLAYYLLCGVAGALFYSLLGGMGFFGEWWRMVPLVGASASIYGVLVATAFLFPYARVQLLIPPVNVAVRTLVLFVLGVAVMWILFNWENAGGEAGHLGGMIMGAALMWLYPYWGKEPFCAAARGGVLLRRRGRLGGSRSWKGGTPRTREAGAVRPFSRGNIRRRRFSRLTSHLKCGGNSPQADAGEAGRAQRKERGLLQSRHILLDFAAEQEHARRIRIITQSEIMSRKPIIAANWKMNMGPAEAREYLAGFRKELAAFDGSHVEKVLVPPFVTIPAVMDALGGCSCVGVGAQNCSDRDNGAYTGEVSTAMLAELGVRYVVLGHSERRRYYGETDSFINGKIKKALAAGLTPIHCIGETLEQRDGGQLESVLRTQVTEGLAGLAPEQAASVVIAYEPVWAIGTGRTATARQAQEAHAFVRSVLADSFGRETAEKIRIQYGGSMKPDNAPELMAQPDIDGGLIGGAGLKPDSFAAIIRAAC